MITVGFTYDLRDDYLAQGFSVEDTAEFDAPETIDAVEGALHANGYVVHRVGNIKALVKALARGERWDIVFNLCEGVSGLGRESQVPCLLEAYDIPSVFSSSDVMALTMNKALAKMVVREHGIATPRFLVVEKEADLARFDLPFPVFAKPIAEGTGKGISERSLIEDKESLAAFCLEGIEKYRQPMLVETYLSGDDLTVGILGSGENARAIGVMEAVCKNGAERGGQTLYNKENCEQVLDYSLVYGPLACKAANVAVQCWRVLGCLDGGRVDLRCDDKGVPHFLEVNPLAGLRPGHSDFPMLAEMAGMDYVTLIGFIMEEAVARNEILVSPLRCVAGGRG